MPVMNRDLYESLCDLNKNFLSDQGLVPADTNLDIVLADNSNRTISQLIVNEKLNKQKQNFKSEYITQAMSIALMLLAGGFTLASFFVASVIVLPVLPILLLGFGIIAITKFIFNFKINNIEANTNEVINGLNQLEMGTNAESRAVTFEIGEQIGSLSEKIDILSANFTQSLFKPGIPPKSNPDSSIDPANEFLNKEEMAARSSSPKHS